MKLPKITRKIIHRLLRLLRGHSKHQNDAPLHDKLKKEEFGRKQVQEDERRKGNENKAKLKSYA